MKRVSLSGAEKTIQEIWDWYEVQSRLSLGKKSKLLDQLREGRPVSDPAFFGMSMAEIHEFFRELAYLTMLDLVAATEAAIRLDYLSRVYERKKDDVSRHFRGLFREQGDRASLESDILATWKLLAPRTKGSPSTWQMKCP